MQPFCVSFSGIITTNIVKGFFLLSSCILSLGGENLAVAQNTYSVNWFKGKELNMVFGLQLSFSRVVSSLCLKLGMEVGTQGQRLHTCPILSARFQWLAKPRSGEIGMT